MSDDIRVIALKCANCGSSLEISNDMNQFACGYCGVQQVVERKGGTVALKLISDAIAKVQVGTDKTAAELAIKRLKEDIGAAEAKATSILNSSNAGSNSYANMGSKGLLVTGLFTALFVIAGLGFLTGGEKGIGVAIILLAIVVVLVGGLITRSLFSSARHARERGNETIVTIRAQIEELKGKLAKQQAIVDQ